VRHTEAPIERVWAILTDARSWNAWGRFQRAALEREGSPTPDGVGALRAFGSGPLTSREEVIVFDAPSHFAYRLVSGLPIVGYRADVFLEPEDEGTRICWKSSFDKAKVPGTGAFYAWFLRTFISDTAKRLAKVAAQPAA
jgi:uncharacterized protein YndB with AHSA1/START domain